MIMCVGSRPGSQFLQLFNFVVVLSISVGAAFEFKLPLLPQHCLLDGEASFVVFLHFVEARRDGSNFLIPLLQLIPYLGLLLDRGLAEGTLHFFNRDSYRFLSAKPKRSGANEPSQVRDHWAHE